MFPFKVTAKKQLNKALLLFGLMLFLVNTAFTQVSDTTQIDSSKTNGLFNYHTARVEYFIGSELEKFIAIDTALDNFQRYNPARKNRFEYAYLGNLGAPYYERYYTENRTIGFDYGRHERDAYLMDINEVKYYRCNVPFTDLYYVAGGQGEQLFHVTHTRNVGKDFNIAIDFNKIVSEGYFQYMKTDYADVTLSGWYKTKDSRYSIYFAGIRSKLQQQENGGIDNDTVFEIQDPASALPLRSEALTNWDNWQGQIQQQYLFGKTVSYAVDDSTSSTYFAPQLALRHTIGFHNYFYQFEDPAFDRSYYGEIAIDNDTLRDRTEVAGFYNRLSLGNVIAKQISKDSSALNPILWEIYALQQYHELSDQNGKLQFTNLIGGFNFSAQQLLDNKISFKGNAAYDFDAIAFTSKAALRFKRNTFSPEVYAAFSSYNPTTIQEHYYSFDYSWNKQLANLNTLSLGLNVLAPTLGFKLNLGYDKIVNYVQFQPDFINSDNAYPQLINAQLLRANISKSFILGGFHFNNNIGVQLGAEELNLPVLIANLSWYYENHLFKSALFFQAGIDAWYNSAYSKYGYNIVNGRWYATTFLGEEGNNTYPTFDVFANFDVETLRFFVKVDNIAQGLFSKGTYIAPNYPMQPRAFRLGLNWFLFY